MRLLATMIAACALTSCSSTAERLCRAQVSETLINPETAEFRDFGEISYEELRRRVGANLLALQRVAPPGPSGELRAPEGVAFYGFRLRAEGRLGNTITSNQVCAVPAEGESCQCVDPEASMSELLFPE